MQKKEYVTSKATVGFRYCTKLFPLEKKYSDADEKRRKDYRQNVVCPLLEEHLSWLDTVHPEKGSKLEDAVWYSMNQKQQLMVFPAHGKVPISNNLAENAVRPFVMGRKNWLFCDSVKGRQFGAIVYSLVETVKVNGLEPYKYLRYILESFHTCRNLQHTRIWRP